MSESVSINKFKCLCAVLGAAGGASVMMAVISWEGEWLWWALAGVFALIEIMLVDPIHGGRTSSFKSKVHVAAYLFGASLVTMHLLVNSESHGFQWMVVGLVAILLLVVIVMIGPSPSPDQKEKTKT